VSKKATNKCRVTTFNVPADVGEIIAGRAETMRISQSKAVAGIVREWHIGHQVDVAAGPVDEFSAEGW